ncbi:MAG: GHKL domain-containing protein [Bacilli bacterium]
MDIFKIVVDITQAVVLSVFSYLYIRKKESRSKFIALVILCILLSLEVLFFDYFTTYEGFSSIIYSLTIFIVLKPVFIGDNLELIILALVLNVIISVCNGIALFFVTFVLNFTMSQFVDSTELQTIGGIISILSLACISGLIIRSRRKILYILTPYSNYFLGIILLLYISITFLEELLFSQKYNEHIILLTWLSFLSLFSLLLILMFKQAKDSSVKINQASISKELELIQDKFNRFEQYNTKISTMRHDLTRTFFVLKNYIISNDEDKAVDVLNELLKETSISPKLVITGNNIIDAIISSKAIDCADLGIEFKYKIDSSCIMYFSEFDLALLLLNSLSNAIENIDEKERVITLDLQNKDNKMVIKVTNTVSNNVLKKNPGLETTKSNKESHGFGIISLQNIARKYNGDVLFRQNNMIFSCLIIISIPVECER